MRTDIDLDGGICLPSNQPEPGPGPGTRTGSLTTIIAVANGRNISPAPSGFWESTSTNDDDSENIPFGRLGSRQESHGSFENFHHKVSPACAIAAAAAPPHAEAKAAGGVVMKTMIFNLSSREGLTDGRTDCGEEMEEKKLWQATNLLCFFTSDSERLNGEAVEPGTQV